ncbi:MAG: PEP-CTERM sorting domain-containing protein [Pseudomonadota bacterium]
MGGGDWGTIESGLLTVNYDQTQAITLTDAHPYFRLRYYLIGGATHANSWVDATGQLAFDLPDGAWITSKAGFLAPVPEPETWTLMGVALGMLAWRLGRPHQVDD